MNAKQAYILSKNYTNKTVIGLGAIKGSNCVIKSIVHENGRNIITFEWVANDGVTIETATCVVLDGTPIYTWTPGNQYEYGDLAIYESCFYRCITPNHDLVFDNTKFNEIGSPDGNYDIVNSKEDLPPIFTPADRKMYYSIADTAFWLWDGYKWELQERSITNDEIDELFV